MQTWIRVLMLCVGAVSCFPAHSLHASLTHAGKCWIRVSNSLALYLDLTHWCFLSFLGSEKRPKQSGWVTMAIFSLSLPPTSFEKPRRRLLGLLEYLHSICQGKNLSRVFLCTFLTYMGVHGNNLLGVRVCHTKPSVERMLTANKSISYQNN